MRAKTPDYSKDFYKGVSDRSIIVAPIVIRALRDLVPYRSVKDIGCGSGIWLREAIRNDVEFAMGLDLQVAIDTVVEDLAEHPGVQLSASDFEKEEYALPYTNLSICLEVLEHLTPGAADRLARQIGETSDAILFSAAQPGQGGTNHINEKPHEYWLSLFDSLGFDTFDFLRPKIQKIPDAPRYYVLNLFLLARRGTETNERISTESAPVNPESVIDLRSPMERIRFSVVKLLPVPLVTGLSRLAKY